MAYNQFTDAAYQPPAGAVLTGYAQTATLTSTKPPQRMELLHQRAEVIAKQAYDLAHRVGALSERVLGPAQEVGQEEPKSPATREPACSLEHIDNTFDSIQSALSRLSAGVARLESL